MEIKDQVKYKIFNSGAQIAELSPIMSLDHKNISVRTGWQLRRWLTKRERLKLPFHPNSVRCNEGRIGERAR